MSSRATVTDTWPSPVNLGGQVNSAFSDTSPSVSADFPALGSSLLFARNDINGWNMRFEIYSTQVIPSLSVQRTSALEDVWTAIGASFYPVSSDTIIAEGELDLNSPQAFYRLAMVGQTGAVHLLSAERLGSRFRVQLRWSR